jgi:3-dehydroquinate dehydratase/shikimate dehydrogenase
LAIGGALLSPLLMNTAFRRENVNAVYLTLHAIPWTTCWPAPATSPARHQRVPYKEEILKHLDNTDPVTSKIAPAIPSSAGRTESLRLTLTYWSSA